mmetsp:Transcript_19058/g.32032  ORF Transcript_19058/g.32032 Transcript_19058/m.32032 type:complete len:308 (+) Transcript_19058:304-1227(+)|eukprot:CAMPEP_0198200674 /NCGR_PEP_ID=MMETSP1445-20131203/3649_1 /TAXON_ID=36898 /ORGANISM="Pyramimonas sp., Strain CCMP2087" /LENGTH=307 /DNA_ID=CAMNT_0043870807 /DNA_START=304 /DNA_END=1227 /DNA_ORIENTATION=-
MSTSVRIAIVQISPERGNPQASMRKVDELLAEYTAESGFDILHLPEMAFTGYNFRDREDIRPLLEDLCGPTVEWCRFQAQRLHCSVVCGFPRREKAEDGSEKVYNSQLVIAPNGDVVEVYDKHHLYDADKTWADEGRCFSGDLELPNVPGVKVGLGICMDINPYEFTAPSTAYEFANFHLQRGTQLVLFSSAWCNSHPDDQSARKLTLPDLVQTINYWVQRLTPLVGTDALFVVANRVGKESFAPLDREGEVIFCGASCILSLKEPALLGLLDTETEMVLVRDVVVPPPRGDTSTLELTSDGAMSAP